MFLIASIMSLAGPDQVYRHHRAYENIHRLFPQSNFCMTTNSTMLVNFDSFFRTVTSIFMQFLNCTVKMLMVKNTINVVLFYAVSK